MGGNSAASYGLQTARDAADSARRAMQIQEATSLLNVEPHLHVEAAFSPFGNPPTPHRIGRTFQCGEGWHSNEKTVRFWIPSPRVPKETDARCYAYTT